MRYEIFHEVGVTTGRANNHLWQGDLLAGEMGAVGDGFGDALLLHELE